MLDAATTDPEEMFLVLAPIGRDAVLTCQLLAKAGLGSLRCADVRELCRRFEGDGAAGLLVAEEVLGGAGLARLAVAVTCQEAWSDIPILVFTGEGATIQRRPPTSHALSALGNVTLLDRPLRPITMQSAARAALRARRRQYVARDELEGQQRAVKERDQFLAMLGHELRNPLAAIKMALELLDQENVGGERYRQIMHRQADHLCRLVDDLLDVSRVTSGKILLRRVPVDLGELVERCLGSIGASIEARGLRVSHTRPDPPAVVSGDPVRLEQIIVNILDNAVKYTPSGGRIAVAIAIAGEQAVLSFQDDGVGIPREMLPRLFDLFAQVEGSLDRAHGGMGIGLTLVRSLVELHGGTVTAASEGVGAGSTFTVRLPLLRAAAPRAEAPAAAAGATGHDVLIVEDNRESRELLEVLLSSRGHRVDAVGDGQEAVEHALRSRPEVLLVDIGLPGLDGYGVARAVRAALGHDVYLIAMTGYGQPADRKRALEAGFDRHMTKPVDMRALSRLLGQPHLASTTPDALEPPGA